MTSQQVALEAVRDLPADEANVEMVRIMGVQLISGRVPAQVRKALNGAVKAGKLGRLKKEGMKPEAYFHPNSETRAKEMRNEEVRRGIEALKSICC